MRTQHRLRLLMAIVCLANLVGCQLAERWGSNGKLANRREHRSPEEDSQPSPPLSASQTADVQVALGRVLEKQGDATGAAQAYFSALQHDPHRADAHWRLAVLHSQQGDFDSATECFQKAVQQQPRNPDIHCDWGYCLYSQNRWQEAEQRLRQATELAPQHARAHNNLALLLARTNRVEESLTEFAAAGRSTSEAYENVAFALTLEQRFAEAQHFCQAALANDPHSKTARKLNSTLSARLDPASGTVPAASLEPTIAGASNGQYGTIQPAAVFSEAR